MRTLFVALALLAACAAPPADGPVSAPTPSDVAVRINAAQNGQTVEVGVNQRFAIELVGVPTAGYVWSATQVPDFITASGEATGNTVQEQSQPGYAGGNHWEVLMFSATRAGSGEIVLEQRRPWESSEPPADTFRVTITAR
jgi:inhibitor of cysteine peptidase